MKIVCLLRHDELWPLLATSRRLRQAAAAAISVHFNFTTPEPQRDERDAVLAVRSSLPTTRTLLMRDDCAHTDTRLTSLPL